ncbi:hypothetical protein ATCC90586_004350 [Pythium insidiosum]|nr:hypothetical protein ATCC90586_004350 [Pythium insidiosum]
MLSPAHRAPYDAASAFGEAPMPVKPSRDLRRRPSRLGRWLSHVRERLVMKLVCCAPASVVFEIELEDEDFQRPEDTTVKQLPLARQKSASIAPVSRPLQRLQSSDRELDIPTNEELERLPIDLSFVLRDDDDEEEEEEDEKALSSLIQQRAARLIQRRWRQFLLENPATDDKTDTEDAVPSTRGPKTRRRRCRKHRGRKKKRSH